MSSHKSTNKEVQNPLARVFLLLVLYRWLSLIPPVLFLIIPFAADNVPWLAISALITAVSFNTVISLFSKKLNRALQSHMRLLLIDLLSVSILIAVTGGWQTPYHLYALSPLIAAAFFFKLRGALGATTVFVPLYLTAVLAGIHYFGHAPDWLAVLTDIVGFYLISSAFGSAAMLLSRLRSTSRELLTANQHLADAHRETDVLHDLTSSLHQAADVEAVQDQVLMALTGKLGFKRVVIGLVDREQNVITNWIGRVPDGQFIETKRPVHPATIPLTGESGLAARALLEGRVYRATDELCTASDWLNTQFGLRGCLIVPMRWGLQPIGVMLVDTAGSNEDGPRLQLLEAIAQQSAAALGMMMTRLRRAQETAVQEERARFALDIHDTVSQSLFGIVFTLDGLLRILPDEQDVVRRELAQALHTAETVRQEVRHTIHDLWPEEITARAFEENLDNYARDTLQATNLKLIFDIRGDFSSLHSSVRRSLYRISQESLTNIVHHAAASEARVCVDIEFGLVRLVVSDNGRGFEPHVALAQTFGQEHFGLQGMQKRVRALGGTCDIFSHPDAGASIVTEIPIEIQESS